MRRFVFLGAALLGFDAGSAFGQIERQHAAHVHGEATLEVSIDGNALALSLEAPGASVVGFERPPADADERARLESALVQLRAPQKWLLLPGDAACRSASVDVESHGFVATSDGEHDHADVDASYRYTCDAPDRLTTIEVHLFDAFPALHKLTVNLALPNRQDRVLLVPGSTRVSLAP